MSLNADSAQHTHSRRQTHTRAHFRSCLQGSSLSVQPAAAAFIIILFRMYSIQRSGRTSLKTFVGSASAVYSRTLYFNAVLLSMVTVFKHKSCMKKRPTYYIFNQVMQTDQKACYIQKIKLGFYSFLC